MTESLLNLLTSEKFGIVVICVCIIIALCWAMVSVAKWHLNKYDQLTKEHKEAQDKHEAIILQLMQGYEKVNIETSKRIEENTVAQQAVASTLREVVQQVTFCRQNRETELYQRRKDIEEKCGRKLEIVKPL